MRFIVILGSLQYSYLCLFNIELLLIVYICVYSKLRMFADSYVYMRTDILEQTLARFSLIVGYFELQHEFLRHWRYGLFYHAFLILSVNMSGIYYAFIYQYLLTFLRFLEYSLLLDVS